MLENRLELLELRQEKTTSSGKLRLARGTHFCESLICNPRR
jgi:hypothetical protein